MSSWQNGNSTLLFLGFFCRFSALPGGTRTPPPQGSPNNCLFKNHKIASQHRVYIPGTKCFRAEMTQKNDTILYLDLILSQKDICIIILGSYRRRICGISTRTGRHFHMKRKAKNRCTTGFCLSPNLPLRRVTAAIPIYVTDWYIDGDGQIVLPVTDQVPPPLSNCSLRAL